MAGQLLKDLLFGKGRADNAVTEEARKRAEAEAAAKAAAEKARSKAAQDLTPYMPKEDDAEGRRKAFEDFERQRLEDEKRRKNQVNMGSRG